MKYGGGVRPAGMTCLDGLVVKDLIMLGTDGLSLRATFLLQLADPVESGYLCAEGGSSVNGTIGG